MKNFVLGLALVGLAFSCKSQSTATVSDAEAANLPAAECCATKANCDMNKADCATTCTSAAKASCPSKAAVQN